jgi:cytochrome c553
MGHAVRGALVVALAAVGCLGGEALSAEVNSDKVMRYGERIAQECLTCHRRDGKDFGIPGIVEMSEADIVTALTLYKTGLRPNKVMVSVASSLDQEQMQAVARYLSSLGKR